MGKRDLFTKILAITGTVLVWVPILAPLFFALAKLLTARRFLFDYLMPAEIFPLVLLGAGMLIWAAFRARLHRKLIPWGLGIAILGLLGAVELAALTGLASGRTEAVGWPWVLVLGFFVIFWIGLLATALGGALLCRSLNARKPVEGQG